ncbi:MAG: DUF177 domain-containing protein [Candidatus Sulfotelmatobacter sp.]
MFFEIKDLELHPIEFAEKFEPGVIDLGADYRQVTPIESSGRADLVEEHHGKHKIIQDIRIQGRLATRLELSCARCLEPVMQHVERAFDLLYRPQGADAGRDEMSVTDAEAEISYYEGEGILLDDVVREQVLLAAPLKVTCREDCKGLCPLCGTNLNQGQCSCAVAQEEPRWAALKEIRSKLAH